MKPKLIIIITSMAFLISACSLDREGIPFPFPGNITPEIVCPGDRVNITWDLSMLNADCAAHPEACASDPLTLDITTSRDMGFRMTPAELMGNATVLVTGTDDFSVTFHAYDTDQDFVPFTKTINVLGPGEELVKSGTFAGNCCGNSVCWDPLTIAEGDKMSPSIRIKKITNRMGGKIRLTIKQEHSGIHAFELGPNESADGLVTDKVMEVKAAPGDGLLLGGDCSGVPVTHGVFPAPINVDVTLGCE